MLPKSKRRVRGWLAQVGRTCARAQARLLLSTNKCVDLSSTASGVESGKPTHFTVVTKGAGKAAVDASFSSPVKDFDIINNYDYSQTVKYTPTAQVRQPRPKSQRVCALPDALSPLFAGGTDDRGEVWGGSHR